MIVYLTESRITTEINLWACLWGRDDVLFCFIGLGYWLNKKTSWARAFIMCYSLIVDKMNSHLASLPPWLSRKGTCYQDNVGLVPRTQNGRRKTTFLYVSRPPHKHNGIMPHTKGMFKKGRKKNGGLLRSLGGLRASSALEEGQFSSALMSNCSQVPVIPAQRVGQN